MPDIVAHGKRSHDALACALCHYPNGKGRAENAGVAGLPYAYIVQTLEDFKNGARKSADPRKGNTIRMAGFAKAMTDDEIKAAAQYFSSMKWTPWIKVVETDTVPKTTIAGGMYMALEGNDKEPIGQRIIEVPVNGEATEQLRDPHSSFIAYVPDRQHPEGRRRWSPPAATAKRIHAALATARTCKALARFPESPAAPQAISPASSTTCRTASATGSGPT